MFFRKSFFFISLFNENSQNKCLNILKFVFIKVVKIIKVLKFGLIKDFKINILIVVLKVCLLNLLKVCFHKSLKSFNTCLNKFSK